MIFGKSLFMAAFAVLVVFPVSAKGVGSEADEPFALGVEAATTVSGAIAIGNTVLAGLSFDIPAGHPLSIMVKPSVSWVSSGDGGILQVALSATMRFFLIAPFVPEDRQAHWGPFIAGGAAGSWAQQQSGAMLNMVAFGPHVEAGYRLVFGDHGIFLEPAVEWTILYGARLDPSGPTAVTSNGLFVSISVGYRF